MERFMWKVMVLSLVLLVPVALFAQNGTIKGKITDTNTGEALQGANVYIVGTSLGAAAVMGGSYTISSVPPGTYTLKVTFIGYKSKSVEVQVTANAQVTQNVTLDADVISGHGITVTANRARERETPVAFTDVKADKITQQFTVQDVPHFFKNSVGVYVTSDGGSGMGDSKVMIRGFDEQRIQVMINNIPVNDPESKKVYWSNWGSLPAASQSIQVQRGVGSSLYGSGSFGGSINVQTSDAPSVRSFRVNMTGGLYDTYKTGFEYNTGLINGKYSFLTRFNYIRGNGWRNSTFNRALQYYFALTNFINEDHTLNIILHGAPQYHSYSYYSTKFQDYARYGRDFNANAYVRDDDPGIGKREKDGTRMLDVLFNRIDPNNDGEINGGGFVSLDNNRFHKPQLEVHHTWSLSDKTYIQNTAFFSMGRGYGENLNGATYKIARNDDGEMTMAAIKASGEYQYRAHSMHNQLGLSSNLNTKWNDHDLNFGYEARYWWARHYGTIVNTFGQDAIGYRIGGVKAYFRQNDVYYDYTTTKPQITGFAHAMWRFGKFSLMTDVNVSYRHYHTWEDIPGSNNLPDDNGDYKITQNLEGGSNDGHVNNATTTYTLADFTKDYTFLQPKLGLNYNLSDQINVFTNYSRSANEPRVKYFYNYGAPIDDFDPETSDDFELGLGYIADRFNVKVNGYYIKFANKSLRIADPTKANQPGYDYKGRRYVPVGEAIYQGVEVAANVNIMTGLDASLAVSKCKNAWGSDITQIAIDDLGIKKGLIEPGFPQLMTSGTLEYNTDNIFTSLAGRFVSDYYIEADNSDVIVDGEWDASKSELVNIKESATLPSYFLLDLVVGYKMNLAGNNAVISLHVNNLLNQEYLERGDEYGVFTGAERNAMINLSLGL